MAEIIAEPATLWHTDLDRNRKVNIDKRYVWKCSGEFLIFKETKSCGSINNRYI
jgi:hypothetical protein